MALGGVKVGCGPPVGVEQGGLAPRAVGVALARPAEAGEEGSISPYEVGRPTLLRLVLVGTDCRT